MKFEICDMDWDSHENVMVFLEKKTQKNHPHKNVQSLEKLSLITTFNIFQNLLKSVSYGD